MKVKKVLGITLAVALCLGLCSCSCSNKDSSNVTTSEVVDYNPLDYVTLGQYQGLPIQLNAADYAVTDDKINSKMQSMCGANNDYEVDASKTVVKGDSIVNVDYVGQLDGVPFDGGSAPPEQ